MGQKLQDGKKVLEMSVTTLHSKCRPIQTIHPTDLGLIPSWLAILYLYCAHLHKNFHLPGKIFKGLKFTGKKCQNGPFLIILPLNFRPLKIVPGR